MELCSIYRLFIVHLSRFYRDIPSSWGLFKYPDQNIQFY